MRPCLRKLRVVRPARLCPSRGSWVCVDEDGPCWAPFEPRRRPQAGKYGDPCSQNADSSPRAQGAPELGRAGRRKGKGEAPRALTACGLGRRVAVDWTWVAPLPHDASASARIGQVPACKTGHDYLRSWRPTIGLRDELAKEARLRQEQEEGVKAREAAVEVREAKLKKRRDRLGVLEQELGARKVELDDKARVLAKDRVAFAEMEKKARSSLKTLYESVLESPLAGTEDGPAKLLPFLVRALEDVALGLGPTTEAEARVLSSAALTRVFTHIYLRDPSVDLDSLLEPASGERAAAAAEPVKGRVEALLGKFRAFSTKSKPGAADPAAP